MREILQDTGPEAITRAIEENQFASWRNFADLLGTEFHEEEDLLWMATRLHQASFNVVGRARLDADSVDKRIEQILDRFHFREVPMVWWTGPLSQPADLGRRLEEHGLQRGSTHTGMAVDLQELNDDLSVPEGLVIVPVSNRAGLEMSSIPYTEVFNLPQRAVQRMFEQLWKRGFSPDIPQRNYLAIFNEQPVACSSLILGGGVAGIYNVATVPAVRGRGIGRAMSLVPLLDAREMGYRVATLQSSEMGQSIYRQLGFREYCQLESYVLQK